MGSYWSSIESNGFDDFRVKYQLSDDLATFFEIESGVKVNASSRMAVTHSIMRWVRTHDLYDDVSKCIKCDQSLAHLLKVANNELVTFEQLQKAITSHLSLQ